METVDNQDSSKGRKPQTGKAEISSLPEIFPPGMGKPSPEAEPSMKRRLWVGLKENLRKYWIALALVTYFAGLGSGYLLRGIQAPVNDSKSGQADPADMGAMADQINPKAGYQIPAVYGDIGPRLLEAGAIDLDQFKKIYQEMGRPLSKDQIAVLTEGSAERIVIKADNQHFLLNLFWAFGLTNQNRVLTKGPMVQNGKEGAFNYASTGGWTIAARPVQEIYASQSIVSLTETQQKRLEEVAQGVYRPCCNNPTHFPDCNHGMAMLGLLELMASQNASVDEMFQAAKYFNAYWFPQQTLEVAVALKAGKNVDFEKAEARLIVGPSMSSGSGFQAVHQWLIQNGRLEQAPQAGGSCGVK